MKYGIDYDGTIANTNAMKVAWIRDNLGRDIEPWKTDRTSCVPLIGLNAYERMGDEVYERRLTLNAPPIPGAAESIIKLSKKGEIFLVTARLPYRIEYAKEWLEKQGIKNCFSGFETSAEVKGLKRSKEQICSDLGLDVLIDDDERHLAEIKLEHLRKILIKNGSTERPDLPNGIEYARSWPEVLDLESHMLISKNIIMMYGYTGTGKSTTAKLLSKGLTEMKKENIVLKTNIARMQGRENFNPDPSYFDDTIEENRTERDNSYKMIMDLSEKYLLEKKIVILDASFNKKYRRDWVYSLVDEIKANLVIVWCECESEIKIKERIKKRYGDYSNPDSQANSFKVYSFVKNQADRIENFELKEDQYKIIHFDTDLEKTEFFNCNESEWLVASIKKICEDISK